MHEPFRLYMLHRRLIDLAGSWVSSLEPSILANSILGTPNVLSGFKIGNACPCGEGSSYLYILYIYIIFLIYIYIYLIYIYIFGKLQKWTQNLMVWKKKRRGMSVPMKIALHFWGSACVCASAWMAAYMARRPQSWTTHSDDFRLTSMFADCWMWAIMHLQLTKLSMIC